MGTSSRALPQFQNTISRCCLSSGDSYNTPIPAWFSHYVTKIPPKKLSILPRFYFHDALEQLKTNCHTNFRFKGVLGFVIEYACEFLSFCVTRHLHDRQENDFCQEILLSKLFMYQKKYYFSVYEFSRFFSKSR